ncbi:MAG: hypothetical protein GWN47_02575 [Woeseiaceae bacterium]|nr:hypothetical protein [Woeseiaceae bacterium]
MIAYVPLGTDKFDDGGSGPPLGKLCAVCFRDLGVSKPARFRMPPGKEAG